VTATPGNKHIGAAVPHTPMVLNNAVNPERRFN
jgi:hypothetical protein